MPLAALLLLALVGVALVAVGMVVLRAVGARPGLARRLAGPSEVRVGQLLDPDAALDRRTVRVSGRIRCRDPLHAGGGERLVAYHRDVEARVGGRWRTIERVRETRSFELWDHDGSLPVDPALAAEPLVTIPKVWRGDPGALDEPHASALARLTERHGPATAARATTRTINVTDHLLLLARPIVDAGGRVGLEPPEGGFVVSNLALDDAMRLLAGRHRRTAAAATIGIGSGVALAVVGLVGSVVAVLVGT